MLVGPGRIAPRLMDDSENRIGADKVPRVDWTAILVADQELWVDRVDSAVAARCATVELALIEGDTFIIFGRSTGRGCSRATASAGISVAGGLLRRIQRAIEGHVVINAHRARRSPGHQRHQPRK